MAVKWAADGVGQSIETGGFKGLDESVVEEKWLAASTQDVISYPVRHRMNDQAPSKLAGVCFRAIFDALGAVPR